MSNLQLITAGLALIDQLNDKTEVAQDDTAVIQRLDPKNSKLTALLIGERPSAEGSEQDALQLYRKMEPLFNESELQGICFDLNVDYENLSGENRLDKLREFVTYMQRRQHLPELITRCAELRPKEKWGIDDVDMSDTAVQPKLNTAVVIDVARPALQNVVTYLDDNDMDANFVVFRHEQAGQFFSTNDDWQQLVITFGDVMDQIKRRFNGSRIHFFMAGPGALLFSMGCIWGTVDDAVVYHYENNKYYPILNIERELRQIPSGWT